MKRDEMSVGMEVIHQNPFTGDWGPGVIHEIPKGYAPVIVKTMVVRRDDEIEPIGTAARKKAAQ